MKNVLLLSFLFFWPLVPCFSQQERVLAFHHKTQGDQTIVLLHGSLGYVYSGPHLFSDEMFTNEIKEDTLIRRFDEKHSFHERTDTLYLKKNGMQDVYGRSFRKVNSQQRNKLIKKYIRPSARIGFYEVFLGRINAYQD